MSVAVVTFSRNKWPHWTRLACESVRAALPDGAVHYILDGSSDWQRHKFESLNLAQYVAWVDDDDEVSQDAIRLCVEALERHGTGLAFTSEGWMDEDGRKQDARVRPVSVWDACSHPGAIHHLAVFRRGAVDEEALQAALQFGVGIDWLARARAMCLHGAVQVPIVGYWWRRHSAGLSNEPVELQTYQARMSDMRNLIASWVTPHARIDQFLPG